MTDDIPTTEFALVDDEHLKALLVPYGEAGQNANGIHVFAAGTVTLPSDPGTITLKLAHDGSGAKQVAAHATLLEETPKGIVATFAKEANVYGERLFAEIKEGRKKNVSPEFIGLVREGVNVVKAQLSGAAAVVLGGFPSAAFFSLAEAETQIPEATPVVEETPAPTIKEEETPVATATVPNTLQAAEVAEETPVTAREAFSIFEAIRTANATPEMLARLQPSFASEVSMFALNDVKYTGAGSVQPDERRSQWVDELWKGLTYVQQIIPLFNHKDLTAKIVSGFRWTTAPAGSPWAGNKANIPSNAPATEAATATAAFWAGGHDHAIEHQIFDTPGYFESYFRMMAESYAAWADAKALTDALAGATSLEADNPSGLDIGAGFSALIDGAAAVIAANALPTFAIVAPALWKSMLKTPSDSVLGYLSAALSIDKGDLDGFVIRPHASLSAGNVLVGAREAMTVYELPGLIKVTAPDTVKGGIDTNVIGAEATLVHKATALQLVTPYTP